MSSSSRTLTLAEFDALPPAPDRRRELIGGRLRDGRKLGPDRRDRAILDRLVTFFTNAGADVRREWRFRAEPGTDFACSLAVRPATADAAAAPALVVLLNAPADTYADARAKREALFAAGVAVVWQEDYTPPFTVHRPGDDRPRSGVIRFEDPIEAGDGLPTLHPAEVLNDLPPRGEELPEGVEKVWTDHLREKHECGPSEHCLPVPITASGRDLTLWVADHLADFDEAVVTAEAGDLLFAIARWEYPGGGYGDAHGHVPVLLVARRHDETNYLVHVWHELYDWAFPHLGLDRPAPDLRLNDGSAGDAG